MCKRLDLSHMFISLLFKSIYTKKFGVINKQIYNSWYETSSITPLVQLCTGIKYGYLENRAFSFNLKKFH